MIEDCTAIILAGGDSRRMGSDKASLMLDGQTLLQRAIAAMRAVFPEVIVSVRQPRPGIDVPQVCDERTIGGPLAGVTAGLEHIDTPWSFVVACDMPFITPPMIRLLAGCRPTFQAVVPVIQGQPQSLSAFYARSCLGPIRTHLAQGGKNSLRAVFGQLHIRYVGEKELSEADPDLRSFFDLDTPQDVADAMQESAGRDSSRQGTPD